jgi:hypothetical protein
MWNVNGTTIKMVEGEYGVDLPLTITGATLTANDEIRLTIKRGRQGNVAVEKSYSDIQDNTINVRLTESESSALRVGKYQYSLAWYQEGFFLCYLIEKGLFEVVDAA